jgi:Bacterial regulatory helix-turn-helix protein, lysR family
MSDIVEFRHLKYIVAVAEMANFTRAAERLFLAQPSLSKQIKDLELHSRSYPEGRHANAHLCSIRPR